jgi:tRNA-uridine 2-sulfurtransferase
MARVFVAMSGGVDSSVAAALAVRDGHDVTGVTMQLWPEGDADGGCCSVDAVRDARRVSDALGIPHYTLNFRECFEDAVVGPFCDAYAAGITPNPCIACNDVVKFAELWRRVELQGADFLATGHYARVVERGGERWLARGLDASKDQSYFLYRLDAAQLARTMFPVGDLLKRHVRALAREFGLPTAERAESQEICFVPGDDVAAFLRARRPEAFVPGDVVDSHGAVVGSHGGTPAFTVGQRRGIGIGGGGGRRYVTAVDPATSTVTVGTREDLRVTAIRAVDPVWRGGEGPREAGVEVRYRGRPVPAVVEVAGGVMTVALLEPVEGVAPGQAVVAYDGDVVLGGGVIEEAR